MTGFLLAGSLIRNLVVAHMPQHIYKAMIFFGTVCNLIEAISHLNFDKRKTRLGFCKSGKIFI